MRTQIRREVLVLPPLAEPEGQARRAVSLPAANNKNNNNNNNNHHHHHHHHHTHNNKNNKSNQTIIMLNSHNSTNSKPLGGQAVMVRPGNLDTNELPVEFR